MFWFDIADVLLPPVYQAIKDMYAYARTIDTELRESLANMMLVRTNFFVQTCDIETVEYWENLLGIQLYGDETIEERKQMILLYMNNRFPTTEAYTRYVLQELFGDGHYDLSFAPNDPFYLRIGIQDVSTNSIKKFSNWFVKMCPAHLIFSTSHVENTQSTNYISAGTTCHNVQKSTCTMRLGTDTVYLGSQSDNVNWVEFS